MKSGTEWRCVDPPSVPQQPLSTLMAYWVKFLRRNKVVIIFPLLTAAAITADLVHTRRWKAQRAAAAAQQPGPPLPG